MKRSGVPFFEVARSAPVGRASRPPSDGQCERAVPTRWAGARGRDGRATGAGARGAEGHGTPPCLRRGCVPHYQHPSNDATGTVPIAMIAFLERALRACSLRDVTLTTGESARGAEGARRWRCRARGWASPRGGRSGESRSRWLPADMFATASLGVGFSQRRRGFGGLHLPARGLY